MTMSQLSDATIDKYIKEFKRFSRKNRLRLRESTDGLPIAVAIGKFKDDQFYCSFEPRRLGLYVRRDSKTQFTFLRKRLEKMGCTPTSMGDDEGVFMLDYFTAPAVAKHLKIIKGRAKVKDPVWLRGNDA